jgi:hypothetical protein
LTIQRASTITLYSLLEISEFTMEDQMDTEPIEQRGTKRAAEEIGTQEAPKPKKIKVRQRVSIPSIEQILILPAGSGP